VWPSRTAQKPSPKDKRIVAVFRAGGSVYLKLVKGSVPDLFPLTIVLNKQLIPARISSLRATFPAGSNSIKPLKINGLRLPVTSH
jgi:hypothetical protein